ncbi:MAG: class I SAM-dependent methyltransferase [Candidatus Sumerlaeaceae bacterium]|nr:class I SAM-dependent methyltransferase [Candidatus Sumerlaeaceae bacterium]
MGLISDLRILYHLALHPIRGATHAERLDNFYRGQAEGYDTFRERLLRGRDELWAALPVPAGGVWLDLGGGTGANAERLGERIGALRKFYIVDLAPSLLAIARRRIAQRGWTHVEAVEADATEFVPAEGAADVVTFSYSLTMIPDWFAAVDHAWRVLRPGGHIGVVDFYVSRKHPAAPGMARHGWLTRHFWPAWFGGDNVFPSPDHLPYLLRRFEPVSLLENRAAVPYLPLARVPYYLFIGLKPQ